MNSETSEDNAPTYMRMAVIQSCAVDDIEMTDALLRVLVALGSYASQKNQQWLWASQDAIARRIGITRQAIGQMTRQLQDLGYVEIQPRYRDDGGRASNWVRLCMDFQLPAERLRSTAPRRKSGRGGRPIRMESESDAPTPETTEVSYPPETPVVSPPETPVVSPPETPLSFSPRNSMEFHLNLERETGKETGKGRSRARDVSSAHQKIVGEPEPENATERDATPTPPPPPPPDESPAVPDLPENPSPAFLWSRVYSRVRLSGLSPAQIASWISPARITAYGWDSAGQLCVNLVAPSRQHVSMIDLRYRYILASAIGSIIGVATTRVVLDVSVEARHSSAAHVG